MKTLLLGPFHICIESRKRILKAVREAIDTANFDRIVTLNPEIMMTALESSQTTKWIQRAKFIIPDGVGVIRALKRRVNAPLSPYPGVEVVDDLLSIPKIKVAVVGGKPNEIYQRKKVLQAKYPKCKWVYFHHGYSETDDLPVVIHAIKDADPDLVIAAMGFPQQEQFLIHCQNNLQRGIGIGCGGAIDVLSGAKRRAPKWTQSLGIEWLYRLIVSPSRIKRLPILFRFRKQFL
ncbi:WecB/TagA/CpsF family glycosyltransferase [bacterium]|jgi:N-acetylglucosaminyldiphosphoundecaprenol N-acetyl-beta-D-mannosaminyltransferase|nr:WecB/TagA/CpsF family glycosyltransferase [bacterium]